MNREAWFVFFGTAIVLIAGGVGFTAWQKHRELGAVRLQLDQVRKTGEVHAVRLAEARREVEVAREREETLAEQMARVANSQRRLESELRSVLESRDVAISELQGRLTVTILDRILFASGDATLKPEGMLVLDEVAKVLARYTNRPVQVFGHTDNVPIRLRFPSNWELSTARAVAAVRYLTEKAGADPKFMSAVGCGEFQPIADNATAEGRARNRRIALVVLPELFVPTDVVPGEVESTAAEPSDAGPADAEPTRAVPEEAPTLPPVGAHDRLPDDGEVGVGIEPDSEPKPEADSAVGSEALEDETVQPSVETGPPSGDPPTFE